jgi:dipeptidyl aminopeptidase/acylaminoacyl peptidase
MVNWMLGRTQRFRAAVSHAGVFDLPSFFGATEEMWFPLWEFLGPPWEQADLYRNLSPSQAADKFKTPTLVVHGQLDYRVPVEQGMQLFTALQMREVPSQFLYFPDEGHWVTKPRNSLEWYRAVLGWLARWDR